MIIYLDVFLIENTILTLIILVSVCVLLKIKINFFKLSLTSFIGSICTFLEYYYLSFNNTYFKLLIKFIISVLIVNLGINNLKYKNNVNDKRDNLKKYKIKKILKIWTVFIVITIIYGGVSFFVQNMFELEDYIIYNKESNFIGIFPIKTVMLGFFIGFIIIYIISKIYNNRIDIQNVICDIEICIKGKKVKTKALIDTGNLLIDPISKKCVLVVEDRILNEIVEKEYLDILRNVSLGKLIGEIKNNKYKIKIIPFNSLGNPNGILCGINPDWVRIYYEKEFVVRNIILGVYFESLNSMNKYSTIIGYGCIKEEFI